MASSSWKNEEDFENDLDLLSNGCTQSHLPKRAPVPSKYMFKLRGKPSIFDDIEGDYEEKLPECIPIRGYPINQIEFKPPGGVPSFLNEDTRSMIREVSGFGYSNHLIEHMLKSNSPSTPEKVSKVPNVAFRATNSCANRHLFKVDNSEEEVYSRSSSPVKIPVSASTCKMQKTIKEDMLKIRNRKDFPELG